MSTEAWAGIKKVEPLAFDKADTVGYGFENESSQALYCRIFYTNGTWGRITQDGKESRALVAKEFAFQKFEEETANIPQLLNGLRLIMWVKGERRWVLCEPVRRLMSENYCISIVICRNDKVYLREASVEFQLRREMSYLYFKTMRSHILLLQRKANELSLQRAEFEQATRALGIPMMHVKDDCMYMTVFTKEQQDHHSALYKDKKIIKIQNKDGTEDSVSRVVVTMDWTRQINHLLKITLNDTKLENNVEEDEKCISEAEYNRQNKFADSCCVIQ